MNPIISRIHSGVRVSIIVFWSPNIMMMYFIGPLLLQAPGWRSHPSVGAPAPFSTSSGKERYAKERARRPAPSRAGTLSRSTIEVHVELVGVRPQPDRVHLVGPLVLHPGVDHVLGEHPTLQQPLVVGLERVEHLLQRAGHLLHRGLLLGRQVVQVL